MANEKIKAAVAVADCKKSDFGTEEAKELYTTIGNVSETEIASLVRQGRNQMNTSSNEALKIFKQVLAVDEENQEAMFYMGRCYQNLNKNSKAEKWYEKAIAVNDTTTFASQAERYLAQVRDEQ